MESNSSGFPNPKDNTTLFYVFESNVGEDISRKHQPSTICQTRSPTLPLYPNLYSRLGYKKKLVKEKAEKIQQLRREIAELHSSIIHLESCLR